MEMKRVEKAFFAAMQNGYAAGGKYATVPGLKGARSFLWIYDGLTIQDIYYGNQKGQSFGTTVILDEEDVPIWYMRYRGFYPKLVTGVLKKSLIVTYKAETFVGGRGPKRCRPMPSDNPHNLTYLNMVEMNDFTCFRGREEIREENDGVVGYHDYYGYAMT